MRGIGIVALVAGLTALAGCDAVDFGDDGLEEFEAREAAYEALRAAAPAAMTDGADLPGTGSATYDGAARLAVTEDGALGDLSMTVGFADGAVGGTISDLISGEGEEIGGVLTVSGGSLDRDPDLGERMLRANLDGTLDAPNGDEVVVDGVMLGDFYGADGQFILGTIEGETCVDGVCQGGAEGLGDFAAASD